MDKDTKIRQVNNALEMFYTQFDLLKEQVEALQAIDKLVTNDDYFFNKLSDNCFTISQRLSKTDMFLSIVNRIASEK